MSKSTTCIDESIHRLLRVHPKTNCDQLERQWKTHKWTDKKQQNAERSRVKKYFRPRVRDNNLSSKGAQDCSYFAPGWQSNWELEDQLCDSHHCLGTTSPVNTCESHVFLPTHICHLQKFMTTFPRRSEIWTCWLTHGLYELKEQCSGPLASSLGALLDPFGTKRSTQECRIETHYDII